MNLRGHFLQPGARGCHQSDRAAAHDIGKTQRHAGDDRGAAVRAHHDQILADGELLERHFLCDRHVVAEQEYVQAGLQCLEGFGPRVGAWHRDLRDASVGGSVEAHRNRSQRDGLLGRSAGHARHSCELGVDCLPRGLADLCRVGLDDHDQIGRAGVLHLGAQ